MSHNKASPANYSIITYEPHYTNNIFKHPPQEDIINSEWLNHLINYASPWAWNENRTASRISNRDLDIPVHESNKPLDSQIRVIGKSDNGASLSGHVKLDDCDVPTRKHRTRGTEIWRSAETMHFSTAKPAEPYYTNRYVNSCVEWIVSSATGVTTYWIHAASRQENKNVRKSLIKLC